MARASEGRKKSHPLSWGTNGKDPKKLKLQIRSSCHEEIFVSYRNLQNTNTLLRFSNSIKKSRLLFES